MMMQPNDPRLNGTGANQPPLILPTAGMVCPECGFEARRLPNGDLSDTITFTIDGDASPPYHFPCAQKALMRRDADYVAMAIKPWQPREARDGDNSPA